MISYKFEVLILVDGSGGWSVTSILYSNLMQQPVRYRGGVVNKQWSHFFSKTKSPRMEKKLANDRETSVKCTRKCVNKYPV